VKNLKYGKKQVFLKAYHVVAVFGSTKGSCNLGLSGDSYSEQKLKSLKNIHCWRQLEMLTRQNPNVK